VIRCEKDHPADCERCVLRIEHRRVDGRQITSVVKNFGFDSECGFKGRPQKIHAHVDRLNWPPEQGRHGVRPRSIQQRRKNAAVNEAMVRIRNEFLAPRSRQYDLAGRRGHD
jgi:hypothetical protein